ncbi:membrane protein [Ligilactobacillus salitolerans]|uniref:Membrane protein n=1 Tax=Ligilactobacillus salitolerans TaxID=1808352 RepID=A0A401IUV6_9LACO|nr:threonine/serine exporter family protein [Ligilactobacillus salitolerans]GBG95309.1 membrane protein [Ligilactobacillus salitolerans]
MSLYHLLIQISFSYLGTMTFGLFINMPKKALNASSIIGAAGWMLYWFMFKFGLGSILGNFLAAFLVGLLGIVCSLTKKMPSTMFSTGLVPLVPGASGYQALAAFINHQTDLAISKTVHVMMVAGAIALGYVAAQMVADIIYQRKPKQD